MVWFWGDRLGGLARNASSQVRKRVARGLDSVQMTAEGAFDSAKEQVRTGLQAGREYVQPDDARSTSATYHR